MTARVLRLLRPLFQLEAASLLSFAVTAHPTCVRVRMGSDLKNIFHVACERNRRNSVTTRVPAVTDLEQAKHTRARPPSSSLLQEKRKGLKMDLPLDQKPSAPATPDSGPSAGVSARRQAMPEVAAFIDLCRAAYDGQFVDVDAAMANAQQARREHAQVQAEQGEGAAARWLKRNAHRCTFHAEEGGRSVGLASPWAGTSTDTMAMAVSVSVPPSERAHPPIGTPPAEALGGNSAPARAPVAGFGKSPVLGPVSGALSGSVAPARAGEDARAVAGSGFGGAV
jgi:hypothetical protein